MGLAGLLGAGRTELAKVLFGAAVPDKGTVYWMGKECRFRCPADAIASEMGFCTEDRKVEGILPHLSVSENLTVALLPKISLNISDTQLSYITNVDAGHGLIKVGSSLVPFANKFQMCIRDRLRRCSMWHRPAARSLLHPPLTVTPENLWRLCLIRLPLM